MIVRKENKREDKLANGIIILILSTRTLNKKYKKDGRIL